jgi:hypothetical protein
MQKAERGSMKVSVERMQSGKGFDTATPVSAYGHTISVL